MSEADRCRFEAFSFLRGLCLGLEAEKRAADALKRGCLKEVLGTWRPWKGLLDPLQAGSAGRFGNLTGYSAGPTAQPTAACETGSSRPPRALGSRAASPASFGAFALLDGPGLTQFRVQGLGFRILALGFWV